MKNIFKIKFLAILLLSLQNIQADEIAVIDMRAAVLSTQAASDAFKALEEDADYSSNLEQAQSLQAERQALAEKLQKELGVTYIFITHDIATVKAISDEIVVMYQGEVVEQGLKSKILNPPYPDYTELLLSSVPEMDPDWLTNLLNKRSS